MMAVGSVAWFSQFVKEMITAIIPALSAPQRLKRCGSNKGLNTCSIGEAPGAASSSLTEPRASLRQSVPRNAGDPQTHRYL